MTADRLVALEAEVKAQMPPGAGIFEVMRLLKAASGADTPAYTAEFSDFRPSDRDSWHLKPLGGE